MKKLHLKKEIIADMNKTAMGHIVGGQQTQLCESFTCHTAVYPTLDRPCATVQPCQKTYACPTTDCLTGMYPTLDHCI